MLSPETTRYFSSPLVISFLILILILTALSLYYFFRYVKSHPTSHTTKLADLDLQTFSPIDTSPNKANFISILSPPNPATAPLPPLRTIFSKY